MGVSLSVEVIQILITEVMAACLKTADMVLNAVDKVNVEALVLNAEGMVPNTLDATGNPSATTPLITAAVLTVKRTTFAKALKCTWARETCCASKTTTCLSGPISSTSAQKHTSKKNMPLTLEEIILMRLIGACLMPLLLLRKD